MVTVQGRSCRTVKNNNKQCTILLAMVTFSGTTYSNICTPDNTVYSQMQMWIMALLNGETEVLIKLFQSLITQRTRPGSRSRLCCSSLSYVIFEILEIDKWLNDWMTACALCFQAAAQTSEELLNFCLKVGVRFVVSSCSLGSSGCKRVNWDQQRRHCDATLCDAYIYVIQILHIYRYTYYRLMSAVEKTADDSSTAARVEMLHNYV